LLVAEVLGCAIPQIEDIKGIKFGNEDIKVNNL
jgi:hypothetical protein